MCTLEIPVGVAGARMPQASGPFLEKDRAPATETADEPGARNEEE